MAELDAASVLVLNIVKALLPLLCLRDPLSLQTEAKGLGGLGWGGGENGGSTDGLKRHHQIFRMAEGRINCHLPLIFLSDTVQTRW